MKMIDVGDKPVTKRVARASAFLHMQPETIEKILTGKVERAMCSRRRGSRRWVLRKELLTSFLSVTRLR